MISGVVLGLVAAAVALYHFLGVRVHPKGAGGSDQAPKSPLEAQKVFHEARIEPGKRWAAVSLFLCFTTHLQGELCDVWQLSRALARPGNGDGVGGILCVFVHTPCTQRQGH